MTYLPCQPSSLIRLREYHLCTMDLYDLDGKEIIVKDGFNKRQLESELAEDYMKNHAMK